MEVRYKTRTKPEKRLFVKAFFENNPNHYSAEHYGMINGIPGTNMRRWLRDPSINVDHLEDWIERDNPKHHERKESYRHEEAPEVDRSIVLIDSVPSECPVEMISIPEPKAPPITDISEVCTVSPYAMPAKPKKRHKPGAYDNRMRIEINDIAVELPEGFSLQELPMLLGILRKAE